MERYDAGLKIIAGAQIAKERNELEYAHSQYVKGIEELIKLVQDEKDANVALLVRKHVSKFMEEAENLLNNPSEHARELRKRAAMIEGRAKDAEKGFKIGLALQYYTEAADTFTALRHESFGELKKWAGEKALAALNKAEYFQKLQKCTTKTKGNNPGKSADDANILGLPSAPGGEEEDAYSVPANMTAIDPNDEGPNPNSLTMVFARVNKAEVEKILIQGNQINGKFFERFFLTDADEKNYEGSAWKDPDGYPKLSEVQRESHARWGRPSQIFLSPYLFHSLEGRVIVQSSGYSHSFALSLSVCADWERRFGKSLISRSIYPHVRGIPVLSRSGRYVLKMLVNGAVRKVCIDEFLPVKSEGEVELMCSSSLGREEIWACLYEKAYFKLHGSYDFTGWTSCEDLHALCGWIPEEIHLHSMEGGGGGGGGGGEEVVISAVPVENVDSGSDDGIVEAIQVEEVDQEWNKISMGVKKGTGMFTVRSKACSEEEGLQSGIPSEMTFAVLGAAEVNGLKLLKLKSADVEAGWKGRASMEDANFWTADAVSSLGSDGEKLEEDKKFGVFWMPWADVRSRFQSVFCSWSPARFRYHRSLHGVWKKASPCSTHYDDAPQYLIRFRCSAHTMIWLLLSKHYSDAKDATRVGMKLFRWGRKVYSTEGSIASSDMKSSHSLLKIPCPPGDHAFVFVLLVDRPAASLGYTITSYSTELVALSPALDCPSLQAGASSMCTFKSFRHAWSKMPFPGGPLGSSRFPNNPMFRLECMAEERVMVKLLARKEAAGLLPAVCLHLFVSGRRVDNKDVKEIECRAGSSDYIPGSAWKEYLLPPGTFTLVVAAEEEGVRLQAEFEISLLASDLLEVASIVYPTMDLSERKDPPPPPSLPPPPVSSQDEVDLVDAPPRDEKTRPPPPLYFSDRQEEDKGVNNPDGKNVTAKMDEGDKHPGYLPVLVEDEKANEEERRVDKKDEERKQEEERKQREEQVKEEERREAKRKEEQRREEEKKKEEETRKQEEERKRQQVKQDEAKKNAEMEEARKEKAKKKEEEEMARKEREKEEEERREHEERRKEEERKKQEEQRREAEEEERRQKEEVERNQKRGDNEQNPAGDEKQQGEAPKDGE